MYAPSGRTRTTRRLVLAVVVSVLAALVVVGVVLAIALSRDAAWRAPDFPSLADDPDPSVVLQPVAERVRLDTATDFVVVMTTDGIRYSHPDPAEIGRTFRGTIAPAVAGDEHALSAQDPSTQALVRYYLENRER